MKGEWRPPQKAAATNFQGKSEERIPDEFGGADGVRTHDLPGFTGTRSTVSQSFGDLSII